MRSVWLSFRVAGSPAAPQVRLRYGECRWLPLFGRPSFGEPQDVFQAGVEIVQVLLQGAIHHRIVNVPAELHDPVAETDHLA